MIRVTAAILMKNDRVLVAQRRDTDKLAGKWEFPGGKIEIHETPEQCLIREMKEEFDIEVSIGDFFGASMYRYETGPILLLAYHTTWKGGCFSLNAHAAIRWLPLSQMQDIEFAPADMALVGKLQQGYLTT